MIIKDNNEKHNDIITNNLTLVFDGGIWKFTEEQLFALLDLTVKKE